MGSPSLDTCESRRLTGAEYGARVPPNIRDQFQKLVSSSRVVPSLSHYLKFVSLTTCHMMPC